MNTKKNTDDKLDDVISEDDITPEELALLDSTDENSGEGDDELLTEAELDSTDEDGDPLNESDDLSGKDLDVPGADADNADEEIGKRMRK